MGPHQILAILLIALVIVLVWRGPKTLPLLGRAFGLGVKDARKEIDGIKKDAADRKAAAERKDAADRKDDSTS